MDRSSSERQRVNVSLNRHNNASYVRFAAESESEVSTYELDDDLVQEFLGTLHESEDEMPSGKIGSELRKQPPIPVPTKIGAVVKTGNLGDVWIRWGYDSHTTSPWIAENNHEKPYRTDQIGRITEVLSEGVGL